MAKIPFTLEAWLKDKSQRVETRDGRIVHNIWPVKEPIIVNGKRAEVCALIDGEEDALVFFEGGKYLPVNSENPFDLFIVTPEEELTPFEKELESFYNHHLQVCSYDNQGTIEDSLHDGASKLLALARKELREELQTHKDHSDSFMGLAISSAYERGKAEALKDLPRWEKQDYAPQEANIYLPTNELVYHGMAISIDELTKLPGFKED